MTILVTGGAGYIGSHIVRELQKSEKPVIVIDDLSTGYLSRLNNVEFFNLDLSKDSSTKEISDILVSNNVDSVIHLAAKKSAPESVMNPGFYFRQNIGGLLNLCNALEESNVSKFVFSSSCSVYGDTRGAVDELYTQKPISPYGLSKLYGEEILKKISELGHIKLCNLRYFNVAGAGSSDLADIAATNLIPIVVNDVLSGRNPKIFGNEYDTFDGTCIRDYIHVSDLALAHISALIYLESITSSYEDFNIGTGKGVSVSQVIHELGKLLGREIQPDVYPARVGDPAYIVSDVSKAIKFLNWKPNLGLTEMISSTVSSYRNL